MYCLRYFPCLFLLLFTSCQEEATPPTTEVPSTATVAEKTMAIAPNPMVETFWIIFTQFYDGSIAGHPIAQIAQSHFRDYQSHPAMQMTGELIKVYGSDEIVEALLYYEGFPRPRLRYPLRADRIQHEATRFTAYAEALGAFYLDAKVEAFLNQHQHYYQGSIAEIERLLPKGIIAAMEHYYRDSSHLAYGIIPSPAMPTGGYRGIGPYVYTGKGLRVYQNLSGLSAIDSLAKVEDYTAFGYGDRNLLTEMTIHEFGHTFVSSLLEQDTFAQQIEKSVDLFTPAWRELMQINQVSHWNACVDEHIVRLGEIRIATAMGNTKEVERLREQHIEKMHFLLLPALEELSETYENDPDTYPNYTVFIPRILSYLEQLEPADIEQLIAQRNN